ncbi:MAG: DUF2304 family protein [Oligoflexia bacterium]|nr:DUF2304 family protein [Oligoflexia bacterium]
MTAPLFPLLFTIFLFALFAWDFLFLPRNSRRVLHVLAALFFLGGLVALYTEPFSRLAIAVGLGRPVDGVLYVVVVVLIREFFLSRIRHATLEREMTLLVRRLAILNASSADGAPAPRS